MGRGLAVADAAHARQGSDGVTLPLGRRFAPPFYRNDETDENALSVGKVTIIGGFLLPSISHSAQGFAEGTLIYVIQGYPYGNIHTVVDKQTQLSSAWGWGSGYSEPRDLSEQVKIQAGKQLAEEASGMFIKLRTELAERRAR